MKTETELTSISQALSELGNDIIVLGAIKCGQESLVKYLKQLHPEGAKAGTIRKFEVFWHPDKGRKEVAKYPDAKFVIILRDNVERIWSSYHYFSYHLVMSLEEYLQLDKDETDSHGFRSPIVQARYSHWIDFWKYLNPLVIWLEDLKALPDFPHENATTTHQFILPKITDHDRELIQRYLA